MSHSAVSRGVALEQRELDLELRDSTFGVALQQPDLAVLAAAFAGATAAATIVATGGVVDQPAAFAAVLVANIATLALGGLVWRRGRHGLLPERSGAGWWQPGVNLLGCIFFGISAVAGYVVPATGSMLDQAAANWNTSLGAACFLACALDTLRSGRASKMPLRREIRKLEHELESELRR